MSSSTNAARRVFRIQAILILLPVVLLAGLASAAARGDRRQVEERAREQAAGIARALAPSFASQFRERLQQYLAARDALYPPLPGFNLPRPGALAQWIGAPRPPAAVRPRDVEEGDWALPEGVLSPEGGWIVPRRYDRVPIPPGWWTELEPEWRERWEAAVRLEVSGAPRESVVEAWRQCRKPLVNTGEASDYPYDLNVLYQIQRSEYSGEKSEARREALLSFSANPSVQTPSGIPLLAVELSECLGLSPEAPLPPSLFRRLQEAVTEFPSFLTPALLDDALRRDSNPEVRQLQVRWQADERLRRLAPGFVTGETPGAAWITNGTSEYLVIRRPYLQLEPSDREGGVVTNRYVQWGVIPRVALAGLLEDVRRSSRSLIPGYADASVALLHQTVVGSARREADTVLARATVPIGATADLEVPLELELRLIDTDILFRDQRRRELWITAFIGVSVLVSVLGVFQAWRTLRQQIALHEAKSNFVSAVSHELRAPLASVRLLAEGLARDGMADAGKRREYGQFLVEETRRLGTLIENVLSLARLEQGHRPLDIAPTDVRQLISETLRRLDPLADERGLRLEFEDQTGADPLEAAWDGLAVQQALANLLDNALKHGPGGSAVRVTLERIPGGDRPSLRLSVSDHGPGIPPEEKERVFDRFYRRGSELRRETRGVGLGLALVRQIATAHGGRVWVENQPGNGSVFRLELPVENPAV